jgi:hypothetical protein
MVTAGEAGHVADAADHGGGGDGADPEDLGKRRTRRPERHGQFLLGVTQLGVDAAQIIEERRRELAAGCLNGPGRCDRLQGMSSMSCGAETRAPVTSAIRSRHRAIGTCSGKIAS